jgi:gamma-glutamylaminecyclotransferase
MMMHKVFVYGTLKKGYGNHRLLKDSTFLGNALTFEKFTLYDGGFPYLGRYGASQIIGEVYEVDDDTLSDLDRLEGVGHNFYDRWSTVAKLEAPNDDNPISCYIYVASEDTEKRLNRDRIIPGIFAEWNKKHA